MTEAVLSSDAKTTLQSHFATIRQHLKQCIIGQETLIDRLLITLLSKGHMLIEGAPGLAKTTAIKTLAQCVEGQFQRIQFTPDLLPGDLTGTDIFHPDKSEFNFQAGPLFHNIILADEINRAPAKVQSALLEAMAENQITVGRHTYALPELFMVMATQNPLEQEGTYPLPEAQLDRFLMHVTIGYPPPESEMAILNLVRNQSPQAQNPTSVTQAHIKQAQTAIEKVHVSPALMEYLVQIVIATREPERYLPALKKWLRYGASPRATIGLDIASRAFAWLQGRDFVVPEDIQTLSLDILRHRIILSFEAQAEGITRDDIITQLLQTIPVP